MGADVFALTEHDETAGDIAEQNSDGKKELIDILRAAEGTMRILLFKDLKLFAPFFPRWLD